MALEHYYVRSTSRVPEGPHFLSMEFEPTGKPDLARGRGVPGIVKLFVDGAQVGRGEIPITSPFRLGQGAAMLVGADTGAAVAPDYEPPSRFGGTIKRVIVDLSGEHVEDYETEMKIALAKE